MAAYCWLIFSTQRVRTLKLGWGLMDPLRGVAIICISNAYIPQLILILKLNYKRNQLYFPHIFPNVYSNTNLARLSW